VVTVEDDGPGVGNNSLQERIGLGNTRAVLQQLYGRDHLLTLQDAPGGGAVLTLTIPLRTSAQ
jgi:sensor histidine kinase YesM